MMLTFRVDQAEALRRGIDAPSSTVKLDIDPATLTEDERAVLSTIMVDGHDCTRRTIVLGQVPLAWKEPSTLRLVSPTIEGLRDALRDLLQEHHEAALEAAKKDAEKCAKNEEARLQAIQMVQEDPSLLVYPDGSLRSVTVDGYYRCFSLSDLEGDVDGLRDHVEALQAEICEESQRRKSERLRIAEQQSAARQAAYDALYARLPEPMRTRYEAGYETKEMIEKEMRRLARQDAGYAGKEGWGYSQEPRRLTDEQFANLQQVKKSAPEGATVKVLEIADSGGWRKATDDDDPGDIDEDGEVWGDPVNARMVALITWTVGGIEVKATERI